MCVVGGETECANPSDKNTEHFLEQPCRYQCLINDIHGPLPPLQECHPEWLFSESKFLKPESLVELVKVSSLGLILVGNNRSGQL